MLRAPRPPAPPARKEANNERQNTYPGYCALGVPDEAGYHLLLPTLVLTTWLIPPCAFGSSEMSGGDDRLAEWLVGWGHPGFSRGRRRP